MNLDADDLEQRNPYFLPDGRHFIFPRRRGIWTGSLDSREIKQLVAQAGAAVYAPAGLVDVFTK